MRENDVLTNLRGCLMTLSLQHYLEIVFLFVAWVKDKTINSWFIVLKRQGKGLWKYATSFLQNIFFGKSKFQHRWQLLNSKGISVRGSEAAASEDGVPRTYFLRKSEPERREERKMEPVLGTRGLMTIAEFGCVQWERAWEQLFCWAHRIWLRGESWCKWESCQHRT